MIPVAQTQAQPPLALTMLPMVVMLGVFYFLLIRPQQKRQQEHTRLLGALKKGDDVVMASGLHGSVLAVHDDRVVLKVADNVKLEFDKSAVAQVKKS